MFGREIQREIFESEKRVREGGGAINNFTTISSTTRILYQRRYSDDIKE
jgi:hypothetical protein